MLQVVGKVYLARLLIFLINVVLVPFFRAHQITPISREEERRFVDSTFPRKKPKGPLCCFCFPRRRCPSHLDPQGELLSRTNEQGWRVNAREGEKERRRADSVRADPQGTGEEPYF